MINKQCLDKVKYNSDCASGVLAYCDDGSTVPLKRIAFNNVKFIGGLWRIQRDFKEPITIVRDKEFVIRNRLPNQEKNHFEYYMADMVGENCYGKYVMSAGAKYIVAKYDTKNGTYWSYGNSIEQARAFLGIKLYDEYMDLIHNAIGIDKQK